VVVVEREALAVLEGPAVKKWLDGGLEEYQMYSNSRAHSRAHEEHQMCYHSKAHSAIETGQGQGLEEHQKYSRSRAHSRTHGEHQTCYRSQA
jgi:hypothetical protein